MTLTTLPSHADLDLLLAEEAARLLKQKPSTLAYWRHMRTGPPSFKIGKRVVYRRTVLAAWLEEQELLAG